VAGKYRTGKSTLLNRVIINKEKIFNVGSTINSCTKGLILYCELFNDETLIIDSEGFNSIDQEDNDVKLFILIMMLSSFFIYNSVGPIDENALN
jgi:GTPase Era involved in 16S rRNA processing